MKEPQRNASRFDLKIDVIKSIQFKSSSTFESDPSNKIRIGFYFLEVWIRIPLVHGAFFHHVINLFLEKLSHLICKFCLINLLNCTDFCLAQKFTRPDCLFEGILWNIEGSLFKNTIKYNQIKSSWKNQKKAEKTWNELMAFDKKI